MAKDKFLSEKTLEKAVQIGITSLEELYNLAKEANEEVDYTDSFQVFITKSAKRKVNIYKLNFTQVGYGSTGSYIMFELNNKNKVNNDIIVISEHTEYRGLKLVKGPFAVDFIKLYNGYTTSRVQVDFGPLHEKVAAEISLASTYWEETIDDVIFNSINAMILNEMYLEGNNEADYNTLKAAIKEYLLTKEI